MPTSNVNVSDARLIFNVGNYYGHHYNSFKCSLVLRYELGRQAANTKISSNKTVRRVRVRGGNVKWRALRLDTGTYSWGSEVVT